MIAADVLVVGAGIAGLSTALACAPRRVVLVAHGPLGEGASTAWAQGGLAAALGPEDSPAAHSADTRAAGAGLVDAQIANLLARTAPGAVRTLADLMARAGAPLDTDANGAFTLSREAAHAHARVARVGGDGAGRAIHQALIAAARASAHITVLEDVSLGDLLTADERVCGAIFERGEERLSIRASETVLATGGVGGLFAVTTNPTSLLGAGVGAAARAGAAVRDMEFQQFHPTALDIGRDPAPLATEALRGDGARLVDAEGRRLMEGLHPAMELAPRDVVARGVFASLRAGRGAFLDARGAIGEAFPERFPAVFRAAMNAGFDPRRNPLPVAPAMHYVMGGIAVDMDGRTSLEGLSAVGECAATGLHGANRLASNSLTEGLVFGTRIGARLAADPGHVGRLDRGMMTAAPPRRRVLGAEEKRILRATMSARLGVLRDGDGLHAALSISAPSAREPHAPAVARLIAAAACLRTESRGGHHRLDHPAADPAQAVSRSLTLAQADALSLGVADRRQAA